MLQTLRDNFRQAMAVLLACCAILAIAPLAIVRAINAQWLLAGLDSLIVLGMVVILRHALRHKRSTAANIASALFYNCAALAMIYLNPQTMVYWVYPVVIANFFLLSWPQATFANTLVFVGLFPNLSAFPDPLEFTDMLVSLALVSAFAGVFSWKTEDQRSQLERLANVDPLTGIGNRRKLFSNLDRRLSSAGEVAQGSIILLDIDHFKRVNDEHGHETGDGLLRSLSELIGGRLRNADEVFRYGGEEFLLTLEQTPLDGACQLAESLRRQIEKQLGVTVSFGVAQYRPGESWDDWIARADKALYQAKKDGRNCVRPAPSVL